MGVEISSDMIGLEQASDALAQLEAAASATTSAPATKPDQSAPPGLTQTGQNPEGQRAAQAGDAQTPAPAGKPAGDKTPDTISVGEPGDKPAAPKSDTQATTDKNQPPPKAESKCAKEQGRQKNAWQEINSAKDANARERANLEAERKKFNEERESFRSERQKSQPKPEDYERYAEQCEKQGKYDLAEAARVEAKKLRDNPPKTDEQKAKAEADAFESSKKEWWGKAALDFRNVASQGTPENGELQEFIKVEPSVLKDPKAMYYACELIHQRTVAARVPGLEKELGALRAKVKELEGLTSPNPPGLPGRGTAPSPVTEAEGLSALEQEAMSIGPLR